MNPIFIHSLWRSGSTYFFNIFRRSTSEYWCYQEPLHEMTLLCKENPALLLSISEDHAQLLHHPTLEKPYFQELYDVYPCWREVITKEMIYDQYFEYTSELEAFFKTLIDNARGIPVIQECRTSSRIGSIKKAIGGRHIYLWRNPWDQWWSFKNNGYFNKVLLMVLNSNKIPIPVQKFLQKINFFPFHSEIEKELDYFDKVHLNSEQSYTAYYLVWCLALLEGANYSDVMINIDSLSNSSSYRDDTLIIFKKLGISGIDFSDCHVYQSYFSNDDSLFFTKIESQVHNLLLFSGFLSEDIDKILTLREEHRPCSDILDLKDDLKRTREIVFRNEKENAERSKLMSFELFLSHLLFESSRIFCYTFVGFHSKEPWGIWSSGKKSVLRINLKETLLAPLYVRIKLSVKIFAPLAQHSPVVKIIFAHNQAAYVLFRSNQNKVDDIELNFIYDGFNKDIMFECTHEDSPKNHGSVDARILSFGIADFFAEIVEAKELTVSSEEVLFLGVN